MPIMIDLASPSAAPSPDWVAHAFPASVRGNPNYIDLCLDTLESLVFQDCVLPELRPKPLDPVGESRYRLGVFFTNCLSEYADPGNPRQFVDVLPAAGADDDAKKLFFRTTEAALFNSIANAANVPTLRAEMAIHFPVLLGRERSFGALKLPVATKTRPMDAAYREQVNSDLARRGALLRSPAHARYPRVGLLLPHGTPTSDHLPARPVPQAPPLNLTTAGALGAINTLSPPAQLSTSTTLRPLSSRRS